MKKEKAFETIIVLALAGLIFFLIYEKTWLIYIAVLLLIIPLISVKVALFIAKIWFGLSNFLATIMNFLILFVCFYLFLVPLSVLQKVFGKNQILQKQDGNSYFHKREHLFTEEDINRPW